MGTTTPLLPTTPTTTTCTTCSARCWTAPLTGWTTTGALTTATRWAACLTSRTCSTTCATRGPPETTSTSGTGLLRSWPSRSASNNIDVQAMKRDIQKYTMPSEWFKNKYEHLLDTCYEMATNLPADIAENSVVTGD